MIDAGWESLDDFHLERRCLSFGILPSTACTSYLTTLEMPHAIPPNVSHDTPELDCLDFSGETTYGDFRDDIVRDGYAVVKNVISPERAAHYVGASGIDPTPRGRPDLTR